jgi:hypothetical protein
MRQRLADDLKDFRSRMEQFRVLSRDPWIKANSEIDPQRLHALGVISFRWNMSEQLLFGLFAELLHCPEREVFILGHGLSHIALMNRVRVLASTRLEDRPNLIAAIANALDVYDICRQNRNQLTHFDIQIALGQEKLSGFHLVRKRRKPDTFPVVMPFDDTLKNLRRVAKEIRRLNVQLKVICDGVFIRMKPDPDAFAKDWPERATSVSLLKKLPLPEPLWKSSPPTQGTEGPS